MITRIKNDHEYAIVLEEYLELDSSQNKYDDGYVENLLSMIERWESNEYGFRKNLGKPRKACK